MGYSVIDRAGTSGDFADSAALRLTDAILGYNERDLGTILQLIATEIGVRHIACLRFAADKSTDSSLFTAFVTYSTEWQTRYFVKQYINIDPVIAHGRNALLPFDWEVVPRDIPSSRQFFDDAASYGIGRNGLSIPVRSRRGVYSLVSFTTEHSNPEWIGYKRDNMARLQLLSVLIDAAASKSGKLPARGVGLSRREEQCMIWAARGKTYQEIADILDLSFGSVKTNLDTARHKLHCLNLTHAVAVAVATGAIPATSLMRSESGPLEPDEHERGERPKLRELLSRKPPLSRSAMP